jgi:hypothetical protein
VLHLHAALSHPVIRGLLDRIFVASGPGSDA